MQFSGNMGLEGMIPSKLNNVFSEAAAGSYAAFSFAPDFDLGCWGLI